MATEKRSRYGLLLLIGIIAFLSLSSNLWAEEPKFKNPNPVFKPLSPDEIEKAIPEKLGSRPALSGEEMEKIRAGKVVVRERESSGEGKTYEAVAIVPFPPASIVAFMRDYPAYVGIFPHLKKLTATWDGNVVHTENTIRVALSSFNYKLNLLHYRDAMIEWEFVEGDIRDTRGYYKFFPYQGGKQTLLVYHVMTDPGLPIPQAILDLLTKSSMPDVIEAIRKEVARRAESAAPSSTP